MHAKDTALGAQLKQTTKTITNDIDDFDDELTAEMLQVLPQRQGDKSVWDNQ